MTKDENGKTIVGTSTKTGKDRSVALVEGAVTALYGWKQQQKVTQLPGYVFTRRDGSWIAQTTWQKFHTRLCAQADVPVINLHGLRHSAATLQLAHGIVMRITSEILGHSDPRSTRRYQHPSVEMQRAALKSVEQSLVRTELCTDEQTTSGGA